MSFDNKASLFYTVLGNNITVDSNTVTDAWAIGATLTITFQCTRNAS